MKASYLFSDIDGTLIGEDKILSAENIEAINAFRAAGGRVSLATGRSIHMSKRFADVIIPDFPAVLFNGAMIYDFEKEKVLWCARLPAYSRPLVEQVLNDFKDVCAEIMTADLSYIVQPNAYSEEHVVGEEFEYKLCALDNVPDDWCKVIFITSPKRIPELMSYLDAQSILYCENQKEEENKLSFIQSSEFFYEMLPFGCSKGQAVKKICGIMGLDLSSIAAIGDYFNDMDMVEMAGVSAAPANACIPVRERADIVLQNDGRTAVAELIGHLLAT